MSAEQYTHDTLRLHNVLRQVSLEIGRVNTISTKRFLEKIERDLQTEIDHRVAVMN